MSELSKEKRWRMILGPEADPEQELDLTEDEGKIDAALSLLYDAPQNNLLRRSRVRLNEWLTDIRTYFPVEKTTFLQKEAISRLDIQHLLFEPETIAKLEPDIEIIKTILELKSLIPKDRLEEVKQLIERFAKEIEQKIQWDIQHTLFLHYAKAEPSMHPPKRLVNWHRTIRQNLKYYQAELETIMIKKWYGHTFQSRGMPEIFILVDASASMSDTVIYSAIIGSILAQIPSIQTTLILFDTDVVDLSDQLSDIVELLFYIQLGGGTDISKALTYVKSKINQPEDSYVFLISDLFDNYNDQKVFNLLRSLRENQVHIHSILSMDGRGSLNYNKQLAQNLPSLQIPCYTTAPDNFAEVLRAALQSETYP